MSYECFGLDKSTANDYRNETLSAGLNVLTGYGTIVIIQPEKSVFNTVVDDDVSGLITVRNKGDTTISLDNIRQCKSANTDCGTVTREFILPGRTHVVQKKPDLKLISPSLRGIINGR